MKNKKLAYTILFGNHDYLRDCVKSEGWDYICFTDDVNLKSDTWDIVVIDASSYFEPKYAARRTYINSNMYTSGYDVSIMFGTQIKLIGDLNKFEAEQIDKEADICLMKHPCRTCIYQEAEIIKKDGIDKAENVVPHMDKYTKEGFPKNFGLSACGIIYRKNNKKVKKFETVWWAEVINGSFRDQLSFDYCRWKNKDCKVSWFPSDYWSILKGEYFQVYRHKTHNLA